MTQCRDFVRRWRENGDEAGVNVGIRLAREGGVVGEGGGPGVEIGDRGEV